MFSKTFYRIILAVFIFYSLVFATPSIIKYLHWIRFKKDVVDQKIIDPTYLNKHYSFKNIRRELETGHTIISYYFHIKDTKGITQTVSLSGRYFVRSLRDSPDIYFAGIPQKKLETVLSKEEILSLLQTAPECKDPKNTEIVLNWWYDRQSDKMDGTYVWIIPLGNGNECAIEAGNGEWVRYIDLSVPIPF